MNASNNNSSACARSVSAVDVGAQEADALDISYNVKELKPENFAMFPSEHEQTLQIVATTETVAASRAASKACMQVMFDRAAGIPTNYSPAYYLPTRFKFSFDGVMHVLTYEELKELLEQHEHNKRLAATSYYDSESMSMQRG